MFEIQKKEEKRSHQNVTGTVGLNSICTPFSISELHEVLGRTWWHLISLAPYSLHGKSMLLLGCVTSVPDLLFLIPAETAAGGQEESSLVATHLANQNKAKLDAQRHPGGLVQPYSWPMGTVTVNREGSGGAIGWNTRAESHLPLRIGVWYCPVITALKRCQTRLPSDSSVDRETDSSDRQSKEGNKETYFSS